MFFRNKFDLFWTRTLFLYVQLDHKENVTINIKMLWHDNVTAPMKYRKEKILKRGNLQLNLDCN